MSDLLTEMIEKYPALTKVEQQIASYVLENASAVAHMSIFDLANACDVGSTSVFRFCTDLGIKGYSDFRMRLSHALALRGSSINPREPDEIQIPPGVQVQQYIHQFATQARNVLYEASLQLDMNTLERAARIIAKSHKICFVGFRESMLHALNAKLRFMRLTDGTEFSTDEHMQLMSVALMRNHDAVVLFSSQKDEKEAIALANLAKQNEVKVVAITSYHSAKLQQLCDIFISTIHQSTEYHYLSTSCYSHGLILDILTDCCQSIWNGKESPLEGIVIVTPCLLSADTKLLKDFVS